MNRYNSNRCGCNRTMADNRRVAGSMQQGCNRCNNNNNNNGNACGNNGNACGSNNNDNGCNRTAGSRGCASDNSRGGASECGRNFAADKMCSDKRCDNVLGDRENSCEKKKDMRGFPVAMAYVPWQEWEDVYPLNKGLQRGTIFEALDKPFFKGRCRN